MKITAAPPTAAHDDVVGRNYEKRYAKQERVFALFDRLLGVFIRSKDTTVPPYPKRILLLNIGHLGDTIISNALLPVLKDAFPDAAIGFVAGSYSRPIVADHPLIERTHFLDHWAAARSDRSRLHKIYRYYCRDLPAMVCELRRARYDLAIDLHAWFPNTVSLMWLAGIPMRIGFDRVGFGPLLNRTSPYVHDRRHALEHQLDLLRLAGVTEQSIALAQPVMVPIGEKARLEAESVLGGLCAYRVLHPASSAARKDWILEHWVTLTRNLVSRGITPVITGAGKRDAAMADAIVAAAPGAVSLVNRLSWHGLLAVLSRAELVYAVDTSIGHAARALGVKVISIYGGMADPMQWAPAGAVVVTNPMPCAPCFVKEGCAHRRCITGVTVEDVERAAVALTTP